MRLPLAFAVAAIFVAGCGRPAPLAGGTKKATIVLYRDASNVCKSVTTPRFKKLKSEGGNVSWKVDDEFDCQAANDVIELKFDKGDNDPLPSCGKKTDPGKKAIDCSVADANTTSGAKYSLWLNGTKLEDPELEIGQ